MAASALMPARISSVFLTATESLPPRNFKSAKTSNSGLGNVKLSRTILTFFTFAGFSIADVFAAAGAFFAAAFLPAVGLGTGVGLAVPLADTCLDRFATSGRAGFAGAFATDGDSVDLEFAAAAGGLVVRIRGLLVKRFIQFSFFKEDWQWR